MAVMFTAVLAGLGLAVLPRFTRSLRLPFQPAPRYLLALLAGLAASPWGFGFAAAAVCAVGTALLLRGRVIGRKRNRQRMALAAQLVSTLARQVQAGMQGRAAAGALSPECPDEKLSAALRALATGRDLPADCPELGGLPAAFAVHETYGVRLAGLLQAVAVDMRDRQEAERAVAIAASGPRFSGYVLALLPIGGVLLGTAMGAAPLAVLAGPAGQVLVPVGVALLGAGLLWTDWLGSRT